MDPILRAIIKCNYWDTDQMVMKPSTAFFELSFGDE